MSTILYLLIKKNTLLLTKKQNNIFIKNTPIQMKQVNRIFQLLVAFCLFSISQINATINSKPFVIPELKEWKGAEGFFTPSARTRIVCPKNQAELMRIANMMAEDCQTMFGFRPEVVEGKAQRGDLALSLNKNKKLGKEGYTIRITDRIQLAAPEAIGVYWGTRTLLQIAEQTENHIFPKGEIKDFPDYAMRGFMMDCGRKFIPLRYMQDYVKIMAYYKMNTFQIHLNDNGFKQFFDNDWSKTYAAFRLESDTYPGLAARDGFYTKKEFIDLQKLAESVFVEIIPEIDAPAHTLAFTHYKPEIGSSKYGMDHFDLFNPETYRFMDALFKEYLEGDEPVFRGPRVHIGTDEYSNKDQNVVEKFRAFTDHYIRYVESFGKQACVWGALTHANGTTPVKSENVLMSTWYNGYAEPKEMAKQGYKLISVPDGMVYIVPATGYYNDYLDTEYLYKEWTPAHIGDVIFKEKDPAIIGGMFAVWNDHVGNGISPQDIHHRVFPAMQTIATKCWDGTKTTLPYAEFNAQREKLSEAPGVNRLGRIGQESGIVYKQTSLTPGDRIPFKEIGYNYRVSFDIEADNETMGTELFRSPEAVFYLSDPISGKLGFARDGYLNTFRQNIMKGDNMHITVEGDNRSTKLYINNKLIENLDIRKIYFNSGKDSIYYVRTLVFPLEKAGQFNSKIRNLVIEKP